MCGITLFMKDEDIDGITGISLCTDIAHEKKIAGLPQICILTLYLRNLTPPNFCIQAPDSTQHIKRFPAPPYLHTRNNQILEVTKAFASSVIHACPGWGYKGLWTKAKLCTPCTEVSFECISSPLMCTDYLHAYLIPLDMLCSQTMCQRKLFLCAFTIVIIVVRGEVFWRPEY